VVAVGLLASSRWARSMANAYWKCSGRRLPGTLRPLMKKVGVD
jgi:hypothetical protein